MVTADGGKAAAYSLVVALAACGLVGAQQSGLRLLQPGVANPPMFEVATIKPSQGNGQTNYGIADGRFSAENVTVVELIRLAYNLKCRTSCLPFSAGKLHLITYEAQSVSNRLKRLGPEKCRAGSDVTTRATLTISLVQITGRARTNLP